MKTPLLAASFFALPLLLATAPDKSRPSNNQDAPVKQSVPGKSQDTKLQKVRQLLMITNGEDMGQQLVKRMVMQFQRMPQVPEGFIAKFKELARPDEFIDMIIPIYAKNVQEKDLDSIIKFFQSEVGKRWLQAQPKIIREQQTVGIKWISDLRQKVMAELRK